MTYNELMLSTFKRKVVQLPLYNNESLVCKSLFVDFGFRVTNPKLRDLKQDHYHCSTLKTPMYVSNLDKFAKLQSLTVPFDFCPYFKDLNDAHDVVLLLSQDSLTELTFSLLKEHSSSVISQMVFMVISKLKQIKNLRISAISAIRKTNIEILNNSLNKESPLEDLEVNFVHEPD